MLQIRPVASLSNEEFAAAARKHTYSPPSEFLWTETLERLEAVTAERDQLVTERTVVQAALDAWENAPLKTGEPAARPDAAASETPTPGAQALRPSRIVFLFDLAEGV